MTPQARTERLRELMAEYGLSHQRVSRLTGRTLDVVYHWVSGKHYAIPATVLENLELKLQMGMTGDESA